MATIQGADRPPGRIHRDHPVPDVGQNPSRCTGSGPGNHGRARRAAPRGRLSKDQPTTPTESSLAWR